MVWILKYVFVILHIITAAGWFGLGLRLSTRARTILELDGSAAKALADDGARSVYFMSIFIVLTAVFSIVAFLLGGGFAGYGPQYHTSLLLILIMVGAQFFIIRSGWSALQDAVSGSSMNTDNAESARKRIAMGTGVGHLLWLIILVLMFWNQLFAVA